MDLTTGNLLPRAPRTWRWGSVEGQRQEPLANRERGRGREAKPVRLDTGNARDGSEAQSHADKQTRLRWRPLRTKSSVQASEQEPCLGSRTATAKGDLYERSNGRKFRIGPKNSNWHRESGCRQPAPCAGPGFRARKRDAGTRWKARFPALSRQVRLFKMRAVFPSTLPKVILRSETWIPGCPRSTRG